MLPMHQVGADGVAPVHISMERLIRIVLVEHMILAVPVDQPVRVIQPVCRRQVVIDRAMGVLCQLIRFCALIASCRVGGMRHGVSLFSYPFTPPIVMPSIRYRWPARKIASTGLSESTTPASTIEMLPVPI